VVDGSTGYVVSRPHRADGPGGATEALRRLLVDGELRRRMGEAARQRAVTELSYDNLARRLSGALASVGG